MDLAEGVQPAARDLEAVKYDPSALHLASLGLLLQIADLMNTEALSHCGARQRQTV
jgi:hypothetical protein